MKKVFSISFVLLMLTAMLKLTVATHYCGGNIVALKVSVTGKLASCGMEKCGEKNYPPAGTLLSTHCCDDIVFFYAIDNNYTLSFPVVPDFYQYNVKFLNIPVKFPVHLYSGLISLYTYISPPDALRSTSVDLSDICIFRI